MDFRTMTRATPRKVGYGLSRACRVEPMSSVSWKACRRLKQYNFILLQELDSKPLSRICKRNSISKLKQLGLHPKQENESE